MQEGYTLQEIREMMSTTELVNFSEHSDGWQGKWEGGNFLYYKDQVDKFLYEQRNPKENVNV